MLAFVICDPALAAGPAFTISRSKSKDAFESVYDYYSSSLVIEVS